MLTVTISCFECRIQFEKDASEFKRQTNLGFYKFYCSPACLRESRVAKANIERICEKCGSKFFVKFKQRTKRFCSISCASAGSVTEFRRSRARVVGSKSENLISASDALKIRERWKYLLLEKALIDLGIPHEFEFLLDGKVFDLALLGKKILVEFDGDYHLYSKDQKEVDILKDELAIRNGWQVVRKVTETNKVVPLTVLSGLI